MQAVTKKLRRRLQQDYPGVHALCMLALRARAWPALTRAALAMLRSYLPSAPPAAMLSSSLVPMLLRLLRQPAYRSGALQCLTEVRGCLAPHLVHCGLHACCSHAPLPSTNMLPASCHASVCMPCGRLKRAVAFQGVICNPAVAMPVHAREGAAAQAGVS
jgi:hypothetical protein